MNLLFISYSCDPFGGSEDQIGWNVPFHASKLGDSVFVITKAEHKENIESFQRDNPDCNVAFYYVDIAKIYKKVFRGLFYSLRIIHWQNKAYRLAKKICKATRIDVIHQVAPVEYRALGKYGNIKNVCFVAGPIGGGFPVPSPMRYYLKGHSFQEALRKTANSISFFLLRINRRLTKCDYVFFTNRETFLIFQKKHLIDKNMKYGFLCDVGTKEELIETSKNTINTKFIFGVPGRLYYRKGHYLLFDSLPREGIKRDYEVQILGDGPEKRKLTDFVSRDAFLKNHVRFVGRINHEGMADFYRNCNIVVLPSLSEATGTVLIESLTYSRPIIAGDYFGAHFLSEYDCGWFYKGTNKDELICSLRSSLLEAINNKEKVAFKTANASKCATNFSWKKRSLMFKELYLSLLNSKQADN